MVRAVEGVAGSLLTEGAPLCYLFGFSSLLILLHFDHELNFIEKMIFRGTVRVYEIAVNSYEHPDVFWNLLNRTQAAHLSGMKPNVGGAWDVK